MEETPKEEKEVIEARKEEVVLNLRRRIYDQHQRLYNLEQEKEYLKLENKSIKEKANTEVRELEEYIQQEAKAVNYRVKKLETTIVQQMEVIDQQNKVIEHMAQGKVNGRISETSQEEHPAGTSQEWNLVIAPRRRAASDRAPVDRAPGDEVLAPRGRVFSGEPAAAVEVGTGEGGAPGVGQAPRTTAQTAQYRQEFPVEQKAHWDCDECSFQTDQEIRLVKHIKSEHRITCFTCRETFENFSNMIEHRRINHPSNRICSKFPNCERGDLCLYKHEGSMADGTHANVNQTQGEEGKVSCRTCKNEFRDKNEMMVHRKIDHINEVKMCKNILAGVNCRKSAVYCWHRHTNDASSPKDIPMNNTAAPAFNVKNFPYGPTPQRAVVGQDNVSLQMIQQTLQSQQQQMTVIMSELMRLRQ